MKSIKNLISRLYIRHQNRDGNIEEFFQLEKYACSLLCIGGIWLGVKSDLFASLEDLSHPTSEVAPNSSTVLDGDVIIQMLKPATAKKKTTSMQK